MSPEELARHLPDRTAGGIARGIARLVSSEELVTGQQLPPIRLLARALGVSPTTVSAAWRTLRQQGVIETGGRRGSVVLGTPHPVDPGRFVRLHREIAGRTLDLSTGTPDPALLPDIGRALRTINRQALVNSYFDQPVLPELEELLRADWPYRADAMTVVNGAVDAIELTVSVVVRFGDRVLVENPAYPPVLDLLDHYGAEVVGLSLDDEGIRPDALAEALQAGPAAMLIVQPRAHNPTGAAITPARCRALADILGQAEHTLVVEDDHAAALSVHPLASLGTYLPWRTVHIRGFSKSHGPDLRLAALAGPDELIGRIVQRRLLGAAWTSRLLQSVLLFLLTDKTARSRVNRARETYSARRLALSDGLIARGVPVSGDDGINMWLEVPNEQDTLLHLAVDRIAAAPGSPFLSAPVPTHHIRITCASIAGDVGPLTERIAAAARHRRSLHRAT